MCGHLSLDMLHDYVCSSFMDEGVVYLGYGNGCVTGDELHSQGFGQVSALSGLDADV
jgi:hypothetical protein